MSFLANNDVVVHGDAERLCDFDDRLRHLDVRARRRWIATRMGVHQDDGGCGEFERALDPLARIERGVVDGPGLALLVGDPVVAFPRESSPEGLLALEGQRSAAL